MSNLVAACVGDMHVCPIKGHGSSLIMPNGSSILVEGKPIARVGDVTGCGAVITQGCPLALAGNRSFQDVIDLPTSRHAEA